MLIFGFKLEKGTIITPLLKIYVFDVNVQKIIGLLSTHLENVSTASFNSVLMLDEKETRIHILELLLR